MGFLPGVALRTCLGWAMKIPCWPLEVSPFRFHETVKGDSEICWDKGFFWLAKIRNKQKPQALGCLGCVKCREVRGLVPFFLGGDFVIGGNAPMCRLLKRFIRVKPWVPCRSEDLSRWSHEPEMSLAHGHAFIILAVLNAVRIQTNAIMANQRQTLPSTRLAHPTQNILVSEIRTLGWRPFSCMACRKRTWPRGDHW